MQKNIGQCKEELKHLGAVAFAREFTGHWLERTTLENLQTATFGLVKDGLTFAIQAHNANKQITELIPASKAVQLCDLAEKYNLPGYTPERIANETNIRLKELNLARTVEDKDPQRISEAYHALQAALADQDTQGEVNGVFRAKEIEDAIMALYQSDLQPGLSTGWSDLDQFYNVREGEMTIITGMPGSGKSTMLDALAVNLYIKHGWRIAFCSPENWPISRHAVSLIEKYIGKPFNRDTLTAQRMNPSEVEYGMKAISDAFFFTQLQEENMNIGSILEIMRSVIEKHDVKGVVLDPWNELEYRRPTTKTETEFISESLGQIRRFARFNKVHIWIVAHPTKLQRKEDGTYPVPRLYDISGSAAFNNKADNGLCVHRKDPRRPVVDIYIQKIRFKEIGKIGCTCLGFMADSGTYFSLPKKDKESQNQ